MGNTPRQETEELKKMLYDSRHPALRRTLVLTVLSSFAAGCGVTGSPIAPEDIGIEAKVRAQRQAEEKRSTTEGRPVSPEEPCRGGPEPALSVLSGVEGSEANGCPPWLPPLQPVGNQ